jgi:hypothetical protein
LADQLVELVNMLRGAHGDNLKSIVLYGSAAAANGAHADAPKKVLVVLDRITPGDLKSGHPVSEQWRSMGNPPPVYFTSREIEDSSDVFPIEFIDMSQARRLLYGQDPFDRLEIPTHNLRHQLEYELRGKLIRLRTVYLQMAHLPNRLAALMADSLDSFAVLFRHVLAMIGSEAPFDKRDAVIKLADALSLDKKVFSRIYQYAADEEIWLEGETTETFAAYLEQLEKVIEAVNRQ